MELINPEIEKLFFQGIPNDEYEFIIDQKQMNMSKFITLLKYIGYQHSNKKLAIHKNVTLDINMKEGNNSYRITVTGKDNIQTVLNNHHTKKNVRVFDALLQEAKSGIGNYEIMNKIRKGVIDHSKYRCKIASETKLSPNDIKLKEEDRHNMMYRYKQRASLVIDENEYGKIQLDVTQVQQATQLSLLMSSPIKYEAELEFLVTKKITEKARSVFTKIMNSLKSVLCTLQSSDTIIVQDEETMVIDEYKKLIYNDKINNHQDLCGMQSMSLELLPFLDALPNQYTVTDKADGERHFLFCVKDKIYLINNNLIVRKIHVKNSENYNNTILDGEIIQLNNKQIFLAFDILFDRGQDMRIEPNLETRYLRLKSVIENLTNVTYPWVKIEKPEQFTLETSIKNHEKNMDLHNDLLNKYVKNDDVYVIFLKYFIFPTGGNKSEIYAYANAMWNKYTNVYKLPYHLDGLIFTPLRQKYTRNLKEIQYQILKWKPKEKNSIDLYIEFVRDFKSKEVLVVFDNSSILDKNEEFDDTMDEKNTIYQIVKLYVGKKNRETNIEIPVPFKQDQELNIAHLYIKDGSVRDIDGNIIQDKTVVEFTYDLVENRDPKKRWIPLRTRYDKTEMVQKYKQKYGNNDVIADRVWQSMNFPIDISDFVILGNPILMQEHVSVLRSKLSAKDIAKYRASDAYYQKKTDLAIEQRAYHNYIKSIYMYNYCGITVSHENVGKTKEVTRDERATTSKRLDVFDIGIGRGGDFNKYYHCRCKSITGIDPDYNNLFSAASDSLIGRLNNLRKTQPNFPPTFIAQANFGISIFDINKQSSTLLNMTEDNKKVLQKITERTYDVLTAMFSFHYLFKDDETITNVISNFKLLKKDGYFLACLFDGDIVNNTFKERKSNIIEEYYTTETGEKELLFTVKAMYDINQKDVNKNGLGIAVYNSTFMDIGTEIVEYLVTPEHLINTMKKAGLELIETETFQNIYATSKDFILYASQYDATKATQKFLGDVSKYYDMNLSINKAAFGMTRLNRFYVFRKTT